MGKASRAKRIREQQKQDANNVVVTAGVATASGTVGPEKDGDR